MRKLYANLFMTVDGVVEMKTQWTMPYYSAELQELMDSDLEETGTVLMGRHSYEALAGYWPYVDPEDEPFAGGINRVHKLVVSASLESVEWENTELIRGNVSEEIAARKLESGKAISSTGSATLVRSLLRADLVDELRLLVFPLVMGDGRRLFDHWDSELEMSLVSSREIDGGAVSLVYAPS